jgi:hypothetical protein
MCSTFQINLDNEDHLFYTRDRLLAPIFMMIMCARGLILWIINVGLLISLGVVVNKLNKQVRQHNYTTFR